MKSFCAGSIFLLFILSCSSKNVTITKDYVINANWSETNNDFAIYKMKLRDSSKNIDLKGATEPELYYGLVKDKSFSYTGFVEYNGEEYSKRKVYFNRDNGFLWWKNFPKSDSTIRILGRLQQNTWYLLAGLSPFRALYYVYLDNSDSLHVFKVTTMTNF